MKVTSVRAPARFRNGAPGGRSARPSSSSQRGKRRTKPPRPAGVRPAASCEAPGSGHAEREALMQRLLELWPVTHRLPKAPALAECEVLIEALDQFDGIDYAIDRPDQSKPSSCTLPPQPEGWARYLNREDVLIIDTETTGTGRRDEVVSIAVIDTTGSTQLNKLVMPLGRISMAATAIHGLTKAKLLAAGARTWPSFHERVVKLLAGATEVLGYNAAFDRRLLEQTAALHGLSLPQTQWVCVMNRRRREGRWGSLATAAKAEGVPDARRHRALNDARTTLEMIRAMASQEQMAAKRREVEDQRAVEDMAADWDEDEDEDLYTRMWRTAEDEFGWDADEAEIQKLADRYYWTDARNVPVDVYDRLEQRGYWDARRSSSPSTPRPATERKRRSRPAATKRTKPARASRRSQTATRVRSSTPSRGSTVEEPFLAMLVIAIFLLLANALCG